MNLELILILISASAISFLISWFTIPVVINIARLKGFLDSPDSKKSHSIKTPTFGGLAIFMAFSISSLVFTSHYLMPESHSIFAGSILLFFLGLKDDILVLPAREKLIGQIIAAIFVILGGGLVIENLHGFLGVYEIPFIASFLLTLFVIIVVTNTINLIDGIDGLASGIGILVLTLFGIFFLKSDLMGWSILCFTFSASLLAFMRFNLFGGKNKIFMGDTGSLLLGFITAVATIKFLSVNIPGSETALVSSAPAFAIGLLAVPLFDALRVFTVRVFQGKSPFAADKNHLHHKCLDLGMSHLKSTIVILGFQGFVILISFLFNSIGIIPLTLFIFFLCICFVCILNYLSTGRLLGNSKLLPGFSHLRGLLPWF